MLQRIEDDGQRDRARSRLTIITSAGGGGGPGGGGGGSSVNRGSMQLLLKPKDERKRIERSDRAWTCGASSPAFPGVIVRANAVGRQQPDEPVPVAAATTAAAGCRSKSAATTWTTRARWRRRAKDLLDTVPGVADARLGRDDGRPELAVRVDRAKAALLGVSASTRGEHDSHERRRHAGGAVPPARQGIPDHRPPARRPSARRSATSATCSSARRRARSCQAKNLMRVDDAVGPSQIQRKNQQRIALRQRRARGHAERGGEGRAGPAAAGLGMLPKDFSDRLRRRGRAAGARRSTSCGWC